MIKVLFLFLLVFSIFFFGITQLKKVNPGDVLYATLCSVYTTGVLFLIVILF